MPVEEIVTFQVSRNERKDPPPSVPCLTPSTSPQIRKHLVGSLNHPGPLCLRRVRERPRWR